MFDLSDFSLSDMSACSAALRGLAAGASSMEEVAHKIVRYLYDHLGDKQTGNRSCALVRFYTTHPFSELDVELREFAETMLGEHAASPTMKCLTLLATVGEKDEWNSRANSVGHKAIPLPSEQVIARLPMIAQLLRQFGLEVGAVLKPDPTLLLDLEQKRFNVFHVPEAVGSPHIPAQEGFVVPFGIRSVVGFGGVLPPGELFASIIFAKVHVPRQTADLFKTLALSTKVAILPFAGKSVLSKSPLSS